MTSMGPAGLQFISRIRGGGQTPTCPPPHDVPEYTSAAVLPPLKRVRISKNSYLTAAHLYRLKAHKCAVAHRLLSTGLKHLGLLNPSNSNLSAQQSFCRCSSIKQSISIMQGVFFLMVWWTIKPVARDESRWGHPKFLTGAVVIFCMVLHLFRGGTEEFFWGWGHGPPIPSILACEPSDC